MAGELEEVLGEDALGEVVQWGDLAVELDAVPCEWELGSRNVGPAAECGWGWLNVVGSWSACGAGCRQ